MDLDIDAFLHCNDLTYLTNGEEELSNTILVID